MDLIFILALLFFGGCFIFRKKLAVLFTRKRNDGSALPVVSEQLHPVIVTYKILAFNARDFATTKDLENTMELRLEQALAGLAKQGVKYEVEFHSTGFVLVYLIKYWC